MTIADRGEGKRVLAAALGAHVDAPMADLGFTRRAGSLSYRRKVDGGFQRLVFDFDLHPRYAKDGILVLPYGEVTFPAVLDVARDMWPPSSAAIMDFTLRFGIEHLSPPSRRTLLVRGPEDADDLARWLADLVRGRLSTVFEHLSSVPDFVRWAEGDHDGIPLSTVDWISVAAAQVHIGDPEGALRTLAEHIDLTNPNHQEFTRAFDHVRSISSHG
jgi:hypothetical protein